MNEAVERTFSLLIIDDDNNCRELLKGFLDDEPYVITEAGSALEAIDILKESSFDLILMDVIMPEMDGIKFLEVLDEMEIKSKVIVLSGSNWAMEEHRKDLAIVFEVSGALCKPFNEDELVSLIKEVLS